jgi:lysozyme
MDETEFLRLLGLQLDDEEGERLVAYLDTEGLWTIGRGHHDPSICEGIVWTREQMDAAFANDVAEKRHRLAAALPWSLRWPLGARLAVLVEMCFQMRFEGFLGFHQAFAAMRDERWHDAAGQMLASLWAKQTPGRAARMARQMETGEWQIRNAAPAA